jgi:formylglycine-generating enzyme
MIDRRSVLLAPLSLAHRDMVRLPGGTFRMGTDRDPLLAEFPDAGPGLKAMLLAATPAHEVTLSAFLLDRYEVTNAQFQRFVRARPEWRKEARGGDYLRPWREDHFPEGEAAHPVVHVTWGAALAYAQWAGKRLPSEAEWEFAARGGRPNPRYPWGDETPAPGRANYGEAGIRHPVAVGSYPPNPYGLYDLAGNVWEFCADPWSEPYQPGARRESRGDLRRMEAVKSERRVIRGGSYDAAAFNLRVTSRDSHRAANPVPHVGFRCARG